MEWYWLFCLLLQVFVLHYKSSSVILSPGNCACLLIIFLNIRTAKYLSQYVSWPFTEQWLWYPLYKLDSIFYSDPTIMLCELIVVNPLPDNGLLSIGMTDSYYTDDGTLAVGYQIQYNESVNGPLHIPNQVSYNASSDKLFMNEWIFDRFTCQSLIYLLLLLNIFQYIMMFSMTGWVVCYLHLKILPASNLQQTIPVNCKKYFSNEIQYLINWLAVLILSICDHVISKTFNPFIFFCKCL